MRRTAVREIKEETGLVIGDKDRVQILSPFLFSSPGMTDESNAFVLVEAEIENLDSLNQDGAVGIFYPMVTWMALICFVSGLWREK